MNSETVSLMVKMPAPLRQQAQAVAKLRGETISEVVRAALRAYIQEALDDARDNRELDAKVQRIDAGSEPRFDHADVWAEIEATNGRAAIRPELPLDHALPLDPDMTFSREEIYGEWGR